ncbi:MAG TPA: tetratricopeptide repeat protein [Polyangiaceae bacterium]|nr:tetratricopeptide repeat protein [Polyangiaceae bacterium]
MSAAERRRARELFRSAEVLMRAGRWEAALVLFDELVSVKEIAAVRYHRGVCNARLGRWPAAHEEYARAILLAAGSGEPDDRFITAESERGMKDAARHTGMLEVLVWPLPPQGRPTLSVDGSPLALDHEPARRGEQLRWGPLRLPKGEHRLEVRYEGREPLRATVTLSESLDDESPPETVRLAWPDPPPRPAPAAPAASREAASRPASASTLPAWVGGASVGLGAASLALFGVQLAEGPAGREASLTGLAIGTGGLAIGAAGVAWALAAWSGPPAAARRSQAFGAPERGPALVRIPGAPAGGRSPSAPASGGQSGARPTSAFAPAPRAVRLTLAPAPGAVGVVCSGVFW